MHVMSSTIKEYNSIQMKGCREIRFSRGGHLFACAQNQGNVFIYNFWTGECPQNMQLKGHSQKVRAIEWFENDMGFATAG